jgi:ubiquinone/menaquinone biosynthesis C-methylase UbiE
LKSESLEKWKNHWQMTAREKNSFKDAFYLMDQIKMEYLLPLLPKKGKRTLEVGAGSGRLSRFLALEGYDTCCLDYSIDALIYARACYEKEGAQGVYVLGMAEHLPFEDNSLDVVFSTGLLEHFEDPMPIVLEMVRVLRKDGLFYSDVVPKKFRLLTSLDFVRPFLGREWNPLFEMPFTKKDIFGFLQKANLRNVTVFPAAVFPPRTPILRGYRLVPLCESIIAQALTPLLKHVDGTIIAEYLGFYYFAYGYK